MGSVSPQRSRTVLERHVLPADTNTFSALYGGRLMEWIDNIASIVATKHARKKVVTGSIDSLFFLAPIRLGDIVRLDARVNYVTKSTMEIEVDVTTEESLTGIRRFATKAFLTYVAVDDNGRPLQVPGLSLRTAGEKQRFGEGRRRSAGRIAKLMEVRKEADKFNGQTGRLGGSNV